MNPLLLEQAARKRLAGKRAMILPGYDQADWQAINASYLRWQMSLFYKSRCHVYVTAPMTPVRSNDEEEIKDTFGPLGGRPEGQKSLPFEVHTLLYLHKDRQGAHKVTTIKDRGNRSYFQNSNLVSLAHQYLLARAGWRNES